MVMKVTFEDEHGEKTVEFDDDVDCVVIIDDDEGNVEIREGTCEDYEDSDEGQLRTRIEAFVEMLNG